MSVSGVSCAVLPGVIWHDGVTCSYQDELAVFRFAVTTNAIEASLLKRLLHPDEIRRADRYHRVEDRQRFLYARSVLRIISGNYTNQPPEQIQFTLGANKKPELSGNTGWHINVSHSGDWILLVIGRVRVGVDVEKINSSFPFQDLLTSSFSEDERKYIVAGADAQQRFYELWTRKEALLKATGRGMVDTIEQVPSLDGLHIVDSDLIGWSGNWLVQSFAVATDYSAAVAYGESEKTPKFYTLTSGLFNRHES